MMKNLESVVLAILQAAEQAAPQPSPARGEGTGRAERQAIAKGNCEAMLTGLRLVSEAAELAARRHNGMHILPQPGRDERDDLIAYVAWAEKVVAGCRGGNAMLDRTFDETVKLARSSL